MKEKKSIQPGLLICLAATACLCLGNSGACAEDKIRQAAVALPSTPAEPAAIAPPPTPAEPATAAAPATRPRIGLALGGGGTRGIAHVGVLLTLEREGIPVDCIAGTSMGAIVGGLYAAGLSPIEIDTLFRNRTMIRSYDTVPIPVRISLIPVFFVPHLFGHHPYDGLYKGNKFADYIRKAVPGSRQNIEDLKIPFAAVATDLLSGRSEAIRQGDLGRALQASSAIPQLRRPVLWQGKLFVDGGVIANLPVEQCRKMGADIVIAVNVDERLEKVSPDVFRKIGSVGIRCLNMHLSQIDAPQLSQADIIIHPQVNGVRLLSRRIKDMDAALVEGEKATVEALPSIREAISKKLCTAPPEDKMD